MKLDLRKIWQVMNKLSYEETKLSEEKDEWVRLLGHRSKYSEMSFDSFLEYYSFRVAKDEIIVFNDDGIPYEDYNNNDFSSVPSVLLSFSDEKLDKWIETEIELQLAKQEREKAAEKENIKAQIQRLQKQLEN